jgi:uncharacterized DUF497 family protein
MLRFEWNTEKAQSNELKHGVSFEEARSVFFDEYALQFFDEEHSHKEDRFIMLGVSNRIRILVVVHCDRDRGRAIRIISARKATRVETTHYAGQAK